MYSQQIASIEHKDGTTRLVYQDAHGQYVFDNEGDVIYGVWYVPRENLDAKFDPQPNTLFPEP